VTSLVVVSEVSSTSLKAVYMTVGIGVVLYYFFAIGPIGSLSWESVAAAMLVVTIMEGAMSIVDGLTGWNLWHDTGWQTASQSRAVATLANPAVVGTLLGMGIALAVAILVWNGPARLRTIAVLTLLVGLPGLYFTLTRAPIIGTAAGIIFVLMSRTNTRLFAVVSFVLAIVILTVSWSRISASPVYRHRVTNSSNVEIRLQLERWSWKLAEKKPVFGWGYNSFDRAKALAGFTAADLQKNGTSSTSHNSYLTVLVDYGIIGLILLLIPWLVIPWRAFKNVVRRPDFHWFTIGAVAGLIVYVAAANGNDFRFFSFLPAIPWALLGLLRRRQLAEG
jgi:O-antigen ligase